MIPPEIKDKLDQIPKQEAELFVESMKQRIIQSNLVDSPEIWRKGLENWIKDRGKLLNYS